MIDLIIKKLVCLHAWESHAKKDDQWEEEKTINKELYKTKYHEITEILICNKCGKIEKLIY